MHFGNIKLCFPKNLLLTVKWKADWPTYDFATYSSSQYFLGFLKRNFLHVIPVGTIVPWLMYGPYLNHGTIAYINHA